MIVFESHGVGIVLLEQQRNRDVRGGNRVKTNTLPNSSPSNTQYKLSSIIASNVRGQHSRATDRS